MNRLARWIVFLSPLVFLLCANRLAWAQTGAKNGEWSTYGGDLASTRYSPLDQINADNFNKLQVAWRFKTDSLGPRPEFKFESHAADGERRPLFDGRNAKSGRGARRRHGRTALDAQRK